MHPLMNETDRPPASPKSFKSEKQAPAYMEQKQTLNRISRMNNRTQRREARSLDQYPDVRRP